MIRNLNPEDFQRLHAIHRQEPDSGNSGFPDRAPDPGERDPSRLTCPGGAEVGLYVDEKARGRGGGSMERPGRMPDGRWRNVLIMARRSHIAGMD